ncbi:YceD family protein [Anaerosinus gibii]|uniref:DUF177 domain-containing protein n=2 Tax=Selenobaculum TaxID=3074372 RepID=A0A9Y2EUS1_9FIRM|nr:DUF177 domain-containing protein [Selenobaculum gbiensis]WIW69604.1 DUF177 domain-containing protein [Selenobaculum gbiensis]
MMKINVVQPKTNVGKAYIFSFTTSAEELDINVSQYTIDGNVDIKGEVLYTGTCFRISGDISFTKSFQCDRCLEYFSQKQMLSFLEECKAEVSDEDVGEEVICFSGNEVDIANLIRETILLSQPLNNICSPDCRGLCLKCGANLNDEECGCDRHIVDPRLAALQKLLNKR